MIARLPGWSAELCAAGLLLSPADRRQGSLFYAERVRPLRDIHAVLRDVELRFPSPRPRRIVAIEPQVTDEGEYAVIATLTDRTGSSRAVGVVYGDDFYALCVGLPADAAHEARFEELVRTCVARDTHALGVRRRRFVYAPPVGWQGNLTGPFHAAWYPLDFPRNLSCLLVDPATPAAGGEVLDRWMVATVTSAVAGEVLETSTCEASALAGLSGTWLQATVQPRSGAKLVYDYVVFQDDRYLYPLLLQSPADARESNLDVLRPVVRSVMPIPRGRTRGDVELGVFKWLAE